MLDLSEKRFFAFNCPRRKLYFTLLKGSDTLTTYIFNTGIAKHTFCKICGIHSFYRPRSHPESLDINVRCLDGDVIDNFTIESFDGKNWEDNVDKIRN